MAVESMYEMLRRSYGAQVRVALTDRDGSIVAQIAAERQARWGALTPEQQELETLRARVRELEYRLDHVQRVLNGEECSGY